MIKDGDQMQNRIKMLRNKLHITQADFGKSIGVQQNTIARYEDGSRVPSESIIVSICREYNVNREWLKYGEGEMFSESCSVTLDKIAKRYNGSETFRAMLDVYARLTADQQDAFETYVSMLTQAIASGESPESVQPPETSLSARLGSRSESPEADPDQRRAE